MSLSDVSHRKIALIVSTGGSAALKRSAVIDLLGCAPTLENTLDRIHSTFSASCL
jgi:hypothetical protein